MLFMGKFTISMVIFHSYVSHYQRLNPVKSPNNNPQQNLERWDGFRGLKLEHNLVLGGSKTIIKASGMRKASPREDG